MQITYIHVGELFGVYSNAIYTRIFSENSCRVALSSAVRRLCVEIDSGHELCMNHAVSHSSPSDVVQNCCSKVDTALHTLKELLGSYW